MGNKIIHEEVDSTLTNRIVSFTKILNGTLVFYFSLKMTQNLWVSLVDEN